jgi:hypothetical protein
MKNLMLGSTGYHCTKCLCCNHKTNGDTGMML